MTNAIAFSGFADRLRRFIGQSSAGNVPPPEEFETLAVQLFALQFAHVPVYRRFCEARKLSPEKIRSWREIPALPVSAFKEFEVSSLPAEQRTTVFLSSGTTVSRRSRHFHGLQSLPVYESSLVPWFGRHLLADAEDLCLLVLTPPAAAAPHSSLTHMFDTVIRHCQFRASRFLGRMGIDGAWDLDLPRAVTALQACADDSQPVLLLGTAFSFVHLVDHLSDRGVCVRLPAGSRAMETGGYKGRSRFIRKPELQGLIEARLGLPPSHLVSEYGMSELSSQAYDHTAGQRKRADGASPYRFPPWARVQVVSPEVGREVAEGQSGLIQVFDLANVYSVMAVQTEDLGTKRGSGFELIGRDEQAEARGCSLMMQPAPGCSA